MSTMKLETASIATMLSLVTLALMAPAATADGHCHDPCAPELVVTGNQIPAHLNPLGDGEEVYWGWTVVDLVIPEGCDCFVKSVHLNYTVVQDFFQVDSNGVEWKQVDDDTWLVHALDWDLYEITFTAYVYCEDGSIHTVSTTWMQRN